MSRHAGLDIGMRVHDVSIRANKVYEMSVFDVPAVTFCSGYRMSKIPVPHMLLTYKLALPEGRSRPFDSMAAPILSLKGLRVVRLAVAVFVEVVGRDGCRRIVEES
jgi:hypothetical protein